MSTETDNLINERFGEGQRNGTLGGYHSWTLCRYEYYGATNYVELQKDLRHGGGYRLLIQTESGSVPPFVAGTYDADQVERLIEGFPPTNPSFKTDRK